MGRKVLRCDDCNGESVFPIPSENQLDEAYQNFEVGRLIRPQFDEYVRMARICLSEDLNQLARHTECNLSSACSFLDYGCGAGHFVAAAQGMGMDAFGYEIDRESVRLAVGKGLKVSSSSPLTGPVKMQFDFIRSMHVIEHVPNPFMTLQGLADLLRPSGVMVLGVPDQGSFPAAIKRFIRLLGLKRLEWGFVQPPIHLHGFRSQTLRVMAEKVQLDVLCTNKTSPLRTKDFPSTPEYWRDLAIHRLVYRLGLFVSSGGHLLAYFRKPI